MKKIKILTLILALVLVSMIAFFGIYTKVQNRMENKVEGYSYAMDLKGNRRIVLAVDKENKTVIKDSEGKEVNDASSLTDEQLQEKGYQKEEVPYNSEDILTIENYKKSKEIIEKRLKKLNVQNYIIKLDETNGNIIIELTENENVDFVINNIKTKGQFEIVDSETKEVLLDNKDIKLSNVMYSNNSSATSAKKGTSVYIDIEFNNQGSKKLEEVTSTYVKSEESESSDAETTENNGNNEENSESTEGTENTEEKVTEKKITMKVDDDEIVTTNFEEPIRNGKIQLTVGQASTDNKTLQGYVEQASNMATVLDTGNMPIKYDIDENEYVASDITRKELQIVKYSMAIIVLLFAGLLSIKYKFNGILSGIAYIGFLAILMLLIRYTNVIVAIDGLFGIGLIAILQYVFIDKILRKMKEKGIKESVKQSYKEFFVRIIPIAVAVVTFSFIKWIPISSLGMIMFWGISLIAIYNVAVLQNILKIQNTKIKQRKIK